MLPMERLWGEGNRTTILAVSAGIVFVIALVDWWTKPYVSLGFLYLFPIMLAAAFLPRWVVALLGISCAVLAEAFSSLTASTVRLAFETLALVGCGLFVGELVRNRRMSLKPTNRSYRTDETYIKVKGEDRYLYRAVDSTGQTIDFLLTAKRDAAAAKPFFRKALSSPANPGPRVINVDKDRAYPAAVEELKTEGHLARGVRLRQCKYLNNVVEQDHRTVKKRTWLAKGYGSFQTAWRTLQGIEAVHMIRRAE